MSDHANQRRIIKASPQKCFDMVSEPSTPGAYLKKQSSVNVGPELNVYLNESKSNKIENLMDSILKD